jgi:hypothetical protein
MKPLSRRTLTIIRWACIVAGGVVAAVITLNRGWMS